MKYRTMGKLGIRASAFGLGCMRFNGAASGDSVIDEQKAVSLIRRAIDGGVTYIDTAWVYLDKTSEIVLGKALLDTTISGVAFDMLKTVDMVGDKIWWTSSGMCGKKQPMPVGMGGPALRCRITIGGR